MGNKRKIFVLDTNVLVHDPTAILRFPGTTCISRSWFIGVGPRQGRHVEIARNVRQASRLLDETVEKPMATSPVG